MISRKSRPKGLSRVCPSKIVLSRRSEKLPTISPSAFSKTPASLNARIILSMWYRYSSMSSINRYESLTFGKYGVPRSE